MSFRNLIEINIIDMSKIKHHFMYKSKHVIFSIQKKENLILVFLPDNQTIFVKRY